MATLLVNLEFRLPAFSATLAHIERLRRECPELEVIHAPTQEAFIKHLSRADYILGYKLSPAWLPLCTRLKWFATPAAGADVLGYKLPAHIRTTYGTFHGPIIAEAVLGMILAVNHGLLPGLFLHRPDNVWLAQAPYGRMLAGTRAVILGFGHIGQAIAQALAPYQVEVLGITTRNIAELEPALPTCDHLILALPATPETNNILSKARIDLLPSTASIYNIGRGNAIDEKALSAALHEQRLYAACLDVQATEPYPVDGPLMTTPRCYLYPHITAAVPDYLDRAITEWIQLYKAIT